MMVKYIMTWSYWLGFACVVIATVWRGLNTIGWGVRHVSSPGEMLWYMSFYKGALLFLFMAVATANYSWFKSQKP